jgi:hypothetical protein
MKTRVAGLLVSGVALAGGVAFGATRVTGSAGVPICVNDVNGTMRVDSACRTGEHPIAIAGGPTSFRRVEVVKDVSDYVPRSGPGDTELSVTASCAADEQAIGGGAVGSMHLVLPSDTFDRFGYVRASWPSSDTEWSAYFQFPFYSTTPGWATGSRDVARVWAICAS